MSKFKTTCLAVVAAALATTSAFAAASTKSGEVKSTDVVKHELTLSSGDVFEVGSNVKLDKIKVGEKVKVSYEVKDGKNIAKSVHPEK